MTALAGLVAGLAGRLLGGMKARLEDGGDVAAFEELRDRLEDLAEATAEVTIRELAGEDTELLRETLAARFSTLRAAGAIGAATAARGVFQDVLEDVLGVVREAL